MLHLGPTLPILSSFNFMHSELNTITHQTEFQLQEKGENNITNDERLKL